MQADLYRNSSDPRTINKVINLVRTVDLQIYESTSIVSPTFLVGRDDTLLTTNYVYVHGLNRFYFINNLTINNGDTMVLECSIDVLETYKSQFLNNPAILKRSEKYFNLYLNDDKFQAINPSQVTTKIIDRNTPFSPGGISTASKNYVLTVARGE